MESKVFEPVTRRQVLAGSLAAAATGGVRAQTAEQIRAALPLRTTGLEHLGTLVPDVASAGAFYAHVFNPELHKEQEGALRYYVPFGVGYLAIGAAGERPTQIDHYCALVDGYDREAMAARMAEEGIDAGRFGMIPDGDGIRLQLLGVPGGLAPSTEPAGRLFDGAPVFQPLALDHIMLRVSSVDGALPFYRKFFGTEASRTARRAWFNVVDTRLGLEAAADGASPGVAHYGVRVERFDPAAAERALTSLGARIEASDEGVLRFVDPDGIAVEAVAA